MKNGLLITSFVPMFSVAFWTYVTPSVVFFALIVHLYCFPSMIVTFGKLSGPTASAHISSGTFSTIDVIVVVSPDTLPDAVAAA